MSGERTAAVTGASGYLGSAISTALETRGWRVARLLRSPNGDRAYAYDLEAPVSAEIQRLLESTDLLVHAAYDMKLTRRSDIWRVNVDGTRRLLEAARRAGVRRVLVLSSMSAYEGTRQLYGRAKLEIEAMTEEYGAWALRPGLVYGGEGSSGMAGALRRLARLPVVPLIGGDIRLYTVSEQDLIAAVGTLAVAETVGPSVISIAHPVPVSLRELMATFAAQQGCRRPRFVALPWTTVYRLLRAAERLNLPLPFRADSLLGLVRTAPEVTNGKELDRLGVTVHPFAALLG